MFRRPNARGSSEGEGPLAGDIDTHHLQCGRRAPCVRRWPAAGAGVPQRGHWMRVDLGTIQMMSAFEISVQLWSRRDSSGGPRCRPLFSPVPVVNTQVLGTLQTIAHATVRWAGPTRYLVVEHTECTVEARNPLIPFPTLTYQ